MSEPLEEAVEESWLEYLNRFDEHIYPVLFKSRGLTKAEALFLWELSNTRNAVDGLLARLSEDLT